MEQCWGRRLEWSSAGGGGSPLAQLVARDDSIAVEVELFKELRADVGAEGWCEVGRGLKGEGGRGLKGEGGRGLKGEGGRGLGV
eukprot:4875888-Prymnesium_polylepis.1